MGHLAAHLEPQPLPLLKSKTGHTRRIPRVNRMLLLKRLAAQKRHRAEVMRTHGNLTSKSAALVTLEKSIEVSQYMLQMVQSFGHVTQLQVSWDASTYDTETLVAAIYDVAQNLGAFLPNQDMMPVLTDELHPDIQELCLQGKVTRVDSFSTMRALSHALQAIGKPLHIFAKDPQLHLGPYEATEIRQLVDGKWIVQNSQTGESNPVVPDGFSFADTIVLVSVSDQGPLNLPCMDLCQYKLGLALLPRWDVYHRTWNDVKTALKQSQGQLLKVMLSFSLFYNLNYGPGNSRAWFAKKQAQAKEFLAKHSAHTKPVLDYLPYICEEMQIPEPQRLFAGIVQMKSLNNLGPCVKLMRCLP